MGRTSKRLQGVLRAGLQGAGALFIPPVCLHCGGKRWGRAPLCLGCLRRLRPAAPGGKEPACGACGRPGCPEGHPAGEFPFQAARFLFVMGPELSTLIHGFKYRHQRRNLACLCARARRRPDLLAFLQAHDALIPVPLHGSRRRERGYNQAEAIATELGRLAGVPVLKRGLARRRATGTQTKLGRAGRQANLRGAFACPDPAAIAGRRVVLVDDVFTTGATAAECAAVLLAAGCAAVDVAALARVEADPGRDDFQREMEAAAGHCV